MLRDDTGDVHGTMAWQRKHTFRVAVVVASIGIFLAGADLAVTVLIGDQNARQISELGKIALRRSEAAIDAAGAILNRIVAKGRMDCSAGALVAAIPAIIRPVEFRNPKVIVIFDNCLRPRATHGGSEQQQLLDLRSCRVVWQFVLNQRFG